MLPKPCWMSITQAAVYIKDFRFFIDQGGLQEGWGLHWHIVFSQGKDAVERYDQAREYGYLIRRKKYGIEAPWALSMPSAMCIFLTRIVGPVLEGMVRYGSAARHSMDPYR